MYYRLLHAGRQQRTNEVCECKVVFRERERVGGRGLMWPTGLEACVSVNYICTTTLALLISQFSHSSIFFCFLVIAIVVFVFSSSYSHLCSWLLFYFIHFWLIHSFFVCCLLYGGYEHDTKCPYVGICCMYTCSMYVDRYEPVSLVSNS